MFGKDKKEEFHEKILYEAQPNIFVYSKGILISMFVLGFLFFLYSAGIQYIGNMNVYLIESTKVPMTRYFAIAVFILIMIVLLYIILKLLIWTSIKYTITESRVIVEKGILLQKKNYMPFNTIQDVSRSQSLLGKIFSVGTITLYSAYDGKDMELKDVSSPKKIEDIIFENMRGTHLRTRNFYDDDFNSNFNDIQKTQQYRHLNIPSCFYVLYPIVRCLVKHQLFCVSRCLLCPNPEKRPLCCSVSDRQVFPYASTAVFEA